MKTHFLPLVISISLLFISFKTYSSEKISIIPHPVKMELNNDGIFHLSSKTQLILNEADFTQEIFYLQKLIKSVTGNYLSTSEGDNRIIINVCTDCENPDSYKIKVSDKEIVISAANSTGLFYAIQTLKQLILVNTDSKKITIPSLSIYDYPAYPWRGMMLDVSRHFFSLEYLKKHIDQLALYKFNKFHLHLTDDQGWRLEIKQYPELTQQSAYRTFNRQDSSLIRRSEENPDMALDPRFIINQDNNTLYGGYYTQEEIKDLISYASERHIEIVPEIDMPGHMLAAVSAYPELSCTGKASWGDLFSVPLCPCNEAVFRFLENILDEVVGLFPSKYIHIGADEVEKNTWSESAACKDLMNREGFSSLDELQSYFVERIQTYLTSKGREVIGWDEALEGGINPNLNIMFWRDWIGGIPEKITENGNKIIFTPGYPLYISRADSSIYNIYNMKRFTEGIPENKRPLILGAQANMWTEGIASENRVNSLIYPRLIALSEIVWTPDNKQDWTSFKKRLDSHLKYLDKIQVKHTLPSYSLIPEMKVDTQKKVIEFDFESEKIEPEIYYTLDGSQPTPKSKKYTGTISISRNANITAGIYAEGKMQEPFFYRSADYHKAIGKPVEYINTWNKSYPAADLKTLTDGYRGGERYNDGYWQGFTTDMKIIIDMEVVTTLNSFSATFMQITGPGVYMPEYVEVSLSDNGKDFLSVLKITNDISEEEKQLTFKAFKGNLKKQKARYIKVFAKNKAPDRFLFTDEIVIY